MMSAIGIWMPRTTQEVSKVAHTARLYGMGTVEIQDEAQLRSVLTEHDLTLVCLETSRGATPLRRFTHPARPLYLVGPQNGTLPAHILDVTEHIVTVETLSHYPLMPHVAAAIVAHDYYTQQIGAMA